MDDADSIDLSDNDEFMLDVEITAANVQDAINMALADDDNSNSNLTTNVDLPQLSDELINFDGNKFGEELLFKIDNDNIEKILYQHWKTFVPQCYIYHTNLIKGIIEQRTQEILFRPLDIYLYGTLNTDDAIQIIRSYNKKSTVCGHLFKSEEPTYFCRDCCVDPTCVLCTDCFLQSEHRKHRYKMNVSAGGGYCDCGDPEAWKQNVHCNLHLPHDDNNESADDILNRLPSDLRLRAKNLFNILLRFIIKLLCTGNYQDIPNELKNEYWDGDHKNYVTILFNDEVHTYDQVIHVLSRAIQCTKQDGHELASLVDREGRTAIRIGTTEQCRDVQQTIRIRTADVPLKCEIYPNSFISLQYFAQKLLTYLQNIIELSDGFRRIFCECEIECDDELDDITRTEKALLSEKMLWKSARSALHQIFINSFFMDSEWKKTFAILYMKNYSTVWRNFVKDPDEYVSFTDLSVQVYTVPTLCYPMIIRHYRTDFSFLYRADCFLRLSVQLFTTNSLAKYLISSHNAFQTIVDSFLEYCQSKLDHGKLLFSRTTNASLQHEFRRAQSILYDLKYLLGVVPQEYTVELRENFLNGFRVFLQLLSYMHGMDKVARQVGQHVEFDPEWETAFNLVIKIQSIISSILDWCAQDKELLLGAYEATGLALAEIQKTSDISHLIKDKNNSSIVKTTVNDLKVDCYAYDVAKDPISVHIPVVRLFVALHIHLQKYTNTATTFNNLCEKLKIYPCFIYEEALRIQVLGAQHVAGLWKRNGYSLSNQIYYYSNIKCRKEMYDRDILALQVGASLTPSDTYLIQLMHKFNLLEWIRSPENGHSSETESKVKEKVRIMEEFLHLLLIIIGERHEPGIGKVTREEKLTREVIHQLCISPMAHSELIRGLQDSGQLELGSGDFEAVLKEVADFKRGNATKGNYELKANRLLEYNPFYYHYSKADQCKSEEYVIKRRKLNDDGISTTLFIPCPPLFTESFQPIIHILDSNIFLTLLKACIYRSADSKAQLWSEAILNRALHLITLACYEQERESNFEFYSKCQKSELDKLINQLHLNTPSKAETCKELLAYVIKLYNKFNETNEQLNSSTITTNQDTSDLTKRAQRKRKDLAAQKRAKIIAQMTELQKNFIEKNIQLCSDSIDEQQISTIESISPGTSSQLSSLISSSDQQILSTSPNTEFKFEPMSIDDTYPIVQCCFGRNDIELSQTTKQILTCIFCQENSEVKLNSEALVLSAYVQNSRVLSKTRTRRIENWDTFDPTFMSNDLHWGVHVSSCGHAIHASCWTKYHNSITSQDHRRTLRMRGSANYDTERNEFLCPLCQTLSNTIIPILPSLRIFADERKLAQISFNEWLDGLDKALNGSIESRYELDTHEQQIFFNPCPLTTITKMMAERVAQNFQLLFGFAGDSRVQDFSDSIRERLMNFAKNVYVFGLNVDPDDDNDRIPIILWTSCSYTIQSIEQLLRIDSKSIFSQLSIRQSELINCLTKVSAVYGSLHDSDKIKKHCLKLLSVLLLTRTNIQIPSLIDIDLFHLLVSLCFTLPILFASKQTSPSLTNVPTGNLNDLYLVRLILMAHCIQILSSQGFLYEIKNDNSQQFIIRHKNDDDDDAEKETIQKLIEKIIKNQTPPSSSIQLLSLDEIRDKLKQSLLPLLRCTALFYHHLTGISWPGESGLDEYSIICHYLGLPICLSKLFDIENERFSNDLINNWISNLSTSKSLIKYPILVNELHPLPKEYIDLMNQVSQGVAPYKYARDEARSPCICLTCGDVVVRSSSSSITTPNLLTTNSLISTLLNIDQTVGPCNLHTQQCCGPVGLYLRVKECSLLLLNIINDGRINKTRGTFIPAPYLDDYGETDQNLRRGNPLHLCDERYHALYRRWLSHAIPEDISRNMEFNNTSIYAHNWSQF
ncbi:unnamed protein product [Rotaria sordida]|uniref:E3 ubiquitin-protein ligase n=1 Tax=Rotaria sordida TaxID=392033 RepID=A0A814WZK7_9BILA|nr:unnamed protein product [Rotaria sordida]CAF3681939.1 unnamed protein product [Rotaria sordida]